MKSFLIFLFGVLLGALGWHFWLQSQNPSATERAATVATGAKQQAAAIGEDLSDAAIVARIKGKYLVERDLSALAISVQCDHGHVTLTGGAASDALIGRAIVIAQETKGVTEVTSKLTVRN